MLTFRRVDLFVNSCGVGLGDLLGDELRLEGVATDGPSADAGCGRMSFISFSSEDAIDPDSTSCRVRLNGSKIS